jgi:TrmH family RNA methyltransferase
VVEVFATPRATEQHADLADLAPAWTLVDDRALASLSDSVTPAGLVAVCRHLDVALGDALAGTPRLVAICSDVRDPGNAGTVLRTADAAGADAVVLAGTSVDAYNPKTVRATVGSLFHLPVSLEPDPLAAVTAARAAGLVVVAAAGDGETHQVAAADLLARPAAWLLGNEAHGLSDDLAAAADHRVRIPIHGRAESLNLAAAAAICLYATARAQRRA